MDLRKEKVKSDCLRNAVRSTFGLRLLRDSAHQKEAPWHWRSAVVKSAIRKYIHGEKKRARLAELSRNAKETERMEEVQLIRDETSAASGLRLPPPGAMAPANTTQYLMTRFYEDVLQERAEVLAFPTF